MGFGLVTLSDAARDHIASLLADHGAEAGLRLSLKKGGCAGMEYALEIADSRPAGDDAVEDGSARLFVDPSAMLYLLGTHIDYEVTKLRAGFVFKNPNEVSACGCGESVELVPARAGD
ncbi:MAG: iron-sulfur cluster assembly accessory protein [Devosiaceae bacterium]|nr:iron-sulfur cluster assembly accessory protein [Devosiaceae bacterium MH13]